MSSKIPYVLLLLTLLSKNSFRRVVEAQKLPWILLLASWLWFGFSKRQLSVGWKSSRRSNTIRPPKIVTSVPSIAPNNIVEITIEDVINTPKSAPLVQALHPYSSSLNNSFHLLDSLLPSPNWVTLSTQQGVKVSSMLLTGQDLPFVRGDGDYIGFTAREIISVITNSSIRGEWDERFEGTQRLEELSGGDVLSKTTMRGSLFVAGREFVTVSTTSKRGNDWFVLVSSIETDIACDTDKVRGWILLAGWRIREKKGSCEVTYIVHVDVKGVVPTALVRQIQTSTPLCIARVREYLEKNGSAPFLLNDNLTVESKIVTGDGITMQWRGGEDVFLAFPFAVEVKANGTVSVETKTSEVGEATKFIVKVKGSDVLMNLEAVRNNKDHCTFNEIHL